MGEDFDTMSEEDAFWDFIGESDEDVIRNENYEAAAKLGWLAARRYFERSA